MKTQVLIIESERGWGQRVDEIRYFDTREEAESFCNEYNTKNDKDTVPDWYMYATIGEDSFATRMLEMSGTIKKA